MNEQKNIEEGRRILLQANDEPLPGMECPFSVVVNGNIIGRKRER